MEVPLPSAASYSSPIHEKEVLCYGRKSLESKSMFSESVSWKVAIVSMPILLIFMIIRLRELGRGSDHPDREELVVSREMGGMIHPNPSSLLPPRVFLYNSFLCGNSESFCPTSEAPILHILVGLVCRQPVLGSILVAILLTIKIYPCSSHPHLMNFTCWDIFDQTRTRLANLIQSWLSWQHLLTISSNVAQRMEGGMITKLNWVVFSWDHVITHSI